MSVFHCPLEDRELDKATWPNQNYYQQINDWYYDIQGTYGLNCRMSHFDFMNHYKVLLPAESFMFADSWVSGFDHVWEGDNWFATRHGANGDIVNVMFHDGHTEGRRYAPPIDEIEFSDDAEVYRQSTPWWGGDDQWDD